MKTPDRDATPELPRVIEGVAGHAYLNLWCDVKGGYRSTLYCRSVCACTAWADERRNEARRECPSYAEYLDR
jgi:hypothetical protein